jgi:hypothetical protein
MMITQAAVQAGQRFKLKSYVYFGETEDGVWFEAGDKSFLLKDRKLYPLVERFVSMIDSGIPVAHIIQKAPAPLQAFFPKLLDSLLAHGMVLPVDDDYPYAQPLTEHTGEEELYKVLEDRLQGAALSQALARWQGASVALVGNGYTLKAAACALAASACKSLLVQWEDNPALLVDAAEVEQAIKDFAHPRCAVEFRTGAIAPGALEQADLLLYVSDDGEASSADAIDAILRRSGRPGAIGTCFGGRACVLPPVEDGRVGLAELLHWLPKADPSDASHSPTSLSITGCVAAQAALYQFFGFDQDKRRGMVSVVTPDLEVLPHSLVPTGGTSAQLKSFAHPPQYEMPEARALETFEMLKLALAPWFDTLLGAFAVGSDEGIQQMPLLQYPVEVRRPGNREGDGLVVGWGLDLGQAGIRALCEAVSMLGEPLVPSGTVVTARADADGWRKQAVAEALAASPAFAAAHSQAWIPLDQFDAAPVQVLRRLLRYHTASEARALLHWTDRGNAFVVEVWLDGAAVSSAVAPEVGAALVEALGRACSNFQLREVMGRDYWTERRHQLPAGQEVVDWRTALALAPAAPTATFTSLDALGLPPSIHCGYATLTF